MRKAFYVFFVMIFLLSASVPASAEDSVVEKIRTGQSSLDWWHDGRPSVSTKQLTLELLNKYGLDGYVFDSCTKAFCMLTTYSDVEIDCQVHGPGRRVIVRVLALANEMSHGEPRPSEMSYTQQDMWNRFRNECPGYVVDQLGKFLAEASQASIQFHADLANAASVAAKRVAEAKFDAQKKVAVEKQAAIDAETYREAQERKTINSRHDRISGLQNYKFGMFPKTVAQIQGACQLVRVEGDGLTYAAQSCYPFLGEARTLGFGFGKQGLNRIEIFLENCDEGEIQRVFHSLAQRFSVDYQPTEAVFRKFNEGGLGGIMVGAFQQWSAILFVKHARAGTLAAEVIFYDDAASAIIKERFTALYGSIGN
ncbi:hypothetical protein [Paraburkholderia aromaticivorans]|nr:hypothetical protein [Paraburkholderia aromaticivorans]